MTRSAYTRVLEAKKNMPFRGRSNPPVRPHTGVPNSKGEEAGAGGGQHSPAVGSLVEVAFPSCSLALAAKGAELSRAMVAAAAAALTLLQLPPAIVQTEPKKRTKVFRPSYGDEIMTSPPGRGGAHAGTHQHTKIQSARVEPRPTQGKCVRIIDAERRPSTRERKTKQPHMQSTNQPTINTVVPAAPATKRPTYNRGICVSTAQKKRRKAHANEEPHSPPPLQRRPRADVFRP